MLRAVDPPDPGFLEFLGSVDSDDKNWRAYLAKAGANPAAQRTASAAPVDPNSPPPHPPPNSPAPTQRTPAQSAAPANAAPVNAAPVTPP